MKRTILILTLLMATAGAWAQNLDLFRKSLEQSQNGATVVVKEQGDASLAVESATTQTQRSNVRGYRVGIFYDNSQDARERAAEAEQLFRASFPSIPVYKDYRNPYFIVTVGNCLTQEEATILWGRVKNIFPKAHISRTEFPIAELVQKNE
ncbi:MAG: hypothetical protein IKU92_04220 [Rikenellaceae bacterium]|nr:hypothetical protein [Rikenellaceae bacterium]